MTVNIEDAGFEIRDMIAWVYGSGFPKSLDVSKAMDKAAGAARETTGWRHRLGDARPYAESAARYEGGYSGKYSSATPCTEAAKQWQGWGTGLKPALEPITVARKPLSGTVIENVLEHGTGAINVDGCRVPAEKETGWGGGGSKLHEGGLSREGGEARLTDAGRWPANLIHDGSEEVADLLGSTARFFYCPKASKADRNDGCEELEARTAGECTERTEGSDGLNSPRAGAGRTSGSRNFHPTVKPTELMRYLCRLVTPPNGTVLDPFMGSGSTGVAALLEGFRFIGIERDAEYMRISEQRISSRTRCIQRRLF